RRIRGDIFAGRHSITARDLFRWAERHIQSYQALSENGFMLMAERCRNVEEKKIVMEVLNKHCKHQMDEPSLYNRMECAKLSQQLQQLLCSDSHSSSNDDMKDFSYANAKKGIESISWTYSMKRLFTLVSACLEHSEPVLLVGPTGAGKTTVVQMLALLRRQNLRMINCHQNTETSDILGGLRPVRGKDKMKILLEHSIDKYLDVIASICNVAIFMVDDVDGSIVLDSSDPSPSYNRVELTQQLSMIANTIAQQLTTGHETLALNDKLTLYRQVASLWKMTEPQLFLSNVHELLDMNEVQTLTTMIESQSTQYQSLFEWQNGPLVSAMKDGDILLIDEISLAEDAVLERMNSVLEPSRTLFLAKKGGNQTEEIIANPLFTEIWVPSLVERDEDLLAIIKER
ncbi:type A von Willebrand factor domain-containing protein, partial [Reticulomyxa filosa]